MQDVLTALPDPLLVLNAQGAIEATSPAMVAVVGFDLDGILQASLEGLVELEVVSSTSFDGRDVWAARFDPKFV